MDYKKLNLTIIGHWGAYPGPGEATSCYLFSAEGYNLLLECGSGALSLLQKKHSLLNLDAVTVSHYHADHIADLFCLQYAVRVDMELGLRSSGLPIYGHTEDPSFEKLTYKNFTTGYGFCEDTELALGPFTLTFLKTVHPDPCYAVKLTYGNKSVVYTADTGYFDALVDFSREADLLLCESSLYEEYRGAIPGHLSAGEAAEIAQKGRCHSLILTHLPHFGQHKNLLEQARKGFTGPIQLAESGLSLVI